MKLLQRKSKKKGFTLVELMVVIAIIAVLLLVAVPKLSESTKGAKVRTFEANFRTLVSAVNAAYADTGLKANKVATHASVTTLKNDITGKPTTGATYEVDATTGDVTAKLTDPVNYQLVFTLANGTVAASGTGDDYKQYSSYYKEP